MRTLVIQAGGDSKRMGSDKGLMPFLNGTLIERVIQRLQEVAEETLVTTNHPSGYSFLGVRLATDAMPGRGSLGGLYTALLNATQPLVGVVACDMPFASAALFKAMFLELEKGELDAIIPQTETGNEPFHAVYRRETCLPLVKAALESDKWRVNAWFNAANIRFLSPQEVAVYDLSGMAFHNVNTPEELRSAEDLASSTKESP